MAMDSSAAYDPRSASLPLGTRPLGGAAAARAQAAQDAARAAREQQHQHQQQRRPQAGTPWQPAGTEAAQAAASAALSNLSRSAGGSGTSFGSAAVPVTHIGGVPAAGLLPAGSGHTALRPAADGTEALAADPNSGFAATAAHAGAPLVLGSAHSPQPVPPPPTPASPLPLDEVSPPEPSAADAAADRAEGAVSPKSPFLQVCSLDMVLKSELSPPGFEESLLLWVPVAACRTGKLHLQPCRHLLSE